jgi:hypothetical protein
MHYENINYIIRNINILFHKNKYNYKNNISRENVEKKTNTRKP